MEDYTTNLEIEENQKLFNDIKLDLESHKWQTSNNYIGEDYSNYYVIYSHNRDSSIFEESNYQSIINFLTEKNCQFEQIRFTNWLVGWHESIMIEESQIESLIIASDILDQLNNYPIFDEEDYSNRIIEKALEYWNDPYMVDYALQKINLYYNDGYLKTDDEIEESIGEYLEEIATE
jgi:hypothetical protein